MAKIDLKGQRFGALTVIEESPERASNGGIKWVCQCDCGKVTVVAGSALRHKTRPTNSCGCNIHKKQEFIGKKFNSLTVLRPSEKRVNGKIMWECQCDCGNITLVSTSNLTSGQVKSCGCARYKSEIPLTIKEGDIFGKLTAIQRKGHLWICECSCGELIEVSASELVNGHRTSCGKKCNGIKQGDIVNNWRIIEKTSEKNTQGYFLYKVECIKCGAIKNKTISAIKETQGQFCEECRLQNISGQRFGKLKVLHYSHSQDRKSYWVCQCDCGNTSIVSSTNLKTGNTKSCGCLATSGGELKIKQILEEHNIKYETQKTFSSCIFQDTNQKARFDFYLPDYNILIEYDGQQHFKEVEIFSDSLEKIQQHDDYKNNWCKENNILLIRIPYTKYSSLTIKDLIPNKPI